MSVKSFWTTSRLKVCWYTVVARYDIKDRTQIRKLSPSGQIRYQRRWLLKPASAPIRNRAMRERP